MTATQQVLSRVLLEDIADDFAVVHDYRPKMALVDGEIIFYDEDLTAEQAQEVQSWTLGYLKAVERKLKR